ncbi:MAG: CsbD family protein, partial [Microcystis sp.]
MSTEGKINAIAKNLEGKAEEALGNLTGDKEMQMEGKAKQVQASAMQAAEKVKDA